jgi:hypothetical protein
MSKSKILYAGSQSICGTCEQILLPVGMLLSQLCGLVSIGRPLWRDDESAIFSVITQWSESLRTRNHTLLPHLRLPQPGGPGSRMYFPQEQGNRGSKLHYDWRSVSQYVLASSPPWDLRPDINSVWILLSCLFWAPFLTRGRVCLFSVTVSNDCRPSRLFSFHLTRHTFYLYTVYARSIQPRLSTSDHAPSFVAYTTIAV